MKPTYYIEERKGWFLGKFTHAVISRKTDAIICVSNKDGCELVAKALNLIVELDAGL